MGGGPTTLHYITLHYITLHYITLHYITLHYITLHYTTLHYVTFSIYIYICTTGPRVYSIRSLTGCSKLSPLRRLELFFCLDVIDVPLALAQEITLRLFAAMLRAAFVLALVAQLPSGTGEVCPSNPATSKAIAAEYPYCLGNCTSLCTPLDKIVTAYLTSFDVNTTGRAVCDDAQEWLCAITQGADPCLPLLIAAESLASGLKIPRQESELAAYCASVATTTTTTTPAALTGKAASSVPVSFAWASVSLAKMLVNWSQNKPVAAANQ